MLLSLSLSLLFSQWRQVRSARVPSFYQRNKKCVRTFRKDAFRKWKTWKKNKNNDGNKNEINRGNKERRAERERRMEANSGLHAAKSFIPTLRSILARRTLSSYLAFNDLSTHQIPDPPLLSPRIHCLSFFHVALFPPVPRRDERAMPSKKPSLEQYFRADRRAPLA